MSFSQGLDDDKERAWGGGGRDGSAAWRASGCPAGEWAGGGERVRPPARYRWQGQRRRVGSEARGGLGPCGGGGRPALAASWSGGAGDRRRSRLPAVVLSTAVSCSGSARQTKADTQPTAAPPPPQSDSQRLPLCRRCTRFSSRTHTTRHNFARLSVLSFAV